MEVRNQFRDGGPMKGNVVRQAKYTTDQDLVARIKVDAG
jgi:hypothetical protein